MIKNLRLLFLLLLLSLVEQGYSSEAEWISPEGIDGQVSNQWICYRKDLTVSQKPKSLTVEIAVDSKYWLWVNGEIVIREGGLKRGPTPNDSYKDLVDIAPYIRRGGNKIAVLVWYFGKEGFSHKNSGLPGLYIQSLNTKYSSLNTDCSWKARIHPAFETANEPHPNWRLPESNIRYNATNEIPRWFINDMKQDSSFRSCQVKGRAGVAPWGRLIAREVPQWKDFGLCSYLRVDTLVGIERDTLVGYLPYNAQFTPYLSVNDPQGGQCVDLQSDHFLAGGDVNLRAEYVTKKGTQEYESLGWLNGEKMYYILPKNVKKAEIRYRESGYDTELIHSFNCNDPFIQKFWEKALRTLYVNMRDTYFDCPDRERAQWWGDVVLLMGECFYATTPSTHALMRKGMQELIAWQKKDGSLYSPVPAGNYDSELPGQMLASIGKYGFWNYYLHTGDQMTMEKVYPGVKRYLGVWTLDSTGLTNYRSGGWSWGDWGDNKDMRLILAGWHYMALEAATNMATLLRKEEDCLRYRQQMDSIKRAYNHCWNGYAYRHPSYHDKTDDRVQALAVVSGIAGADKYPLIIQLLKSQFHASPYMEKYIMESLFMMGEGDYAVERMKLRYADMVNHPEHTTLFEGWKIGKEGFGGGTINHAWSGGPLIVLTENIIGLKPLEPGYKRFQIAPRLTASISHVSQSIVSVAGNIKVDIQREENTFQLYFNVPKGSKAVVSLPDSFKRVEVYEDGKLRKEVLDNKDVMEFGTGDYKIYAK